VTTTTLVIALAAITSMVMTTTTLVIALAAITSMANANGLL
jgi:hypothetical protein